MMVHKLVNIHSLQSFKSESLCSRLHIFMGFGGAKLKGSSGQPTL